MAIHEVMGSIPSCANTRPTRPPAWLLASRGLPVVEVERAAEPLAAPYRTFLTRIRGRRREELVTDALVGTLALVVFEVLGDRLV